MSDAQYKACGNSMFTQKLALIIMLMTASTLSAAELKWKDSDEDTESEVAYVDSVTQWGPWELDIEPAAGGLTPPSTGALNARDSRVSLRTNSIAALAPPPGQPVVPNAPAPVPPIVTPIVTPQIPNVTDISPSVPVPICAP